MAPLTTGMLSSLEQAIDQIPNQDISYRNQSTCQLKQRTRERLLFRKLVAKLAGEEEDDQVQFMIIQTRKMSSKTGKMSNLELAIDEIPKQDSPFKNQSSAQLKNRTRERSLFRKLAAKLAGEEKGDQVAFMINQSRKVSSKTYVKDVLKSIPKLPDYVELEKKNRQTHAHVHSLIDQILRIAAGSENIESQKKVFENR